MMKQQDQQPRCVEVQDVLRARDARAQRQAELLERYKRPLISFSMNIAGPVKDNALIRQAFLEGAARIENQLRWHGAAVAETLRTMEFTGCEQLWAVDAPAQEIKKWMCAVEEADELGRLFDIDVLDEQGIRLSRSAERRCLICDDSARSCGRSRRHSADALFGRAMQIIRSAFEQERCRQICECAQRALLYEAVTAPKPGLVDGIDSGAHEDMDIFSFMASSAALGAYFEACARTGMRADSAASPEEMLERLRFHGRAAEAHMLRTAGANTHKGALFSLGILCCAAAWKVELPLAERAAKIAAAALGELKAMRPEDARTGGERQYFSLGYTGVRGEAAAGFPTALNHGLPVLRAALADGCSANEAGLRTLLSLMSVLPDSNILRRCGEETLAQVQRRAADVLSRGACPDELRRMNADFIRENISPGGSADLLAVCWFFYLQEINETNGN